MIRYKLPAEFMDKHGDIVRQWDFARFPTLALKELIDVPALEHVELEAVPGAALQGGFELTVRPKGAGSANRLRRYNNTLDQRPKPTREEILAVLAARNRSPEEQKTHEQEALEPEQ